MLLQEKIKKIKFKYEMLKCKGVLPFHVVTSKIPDKLYNIYFVDEYKDGDISFYSGVMCAGKNKHGMMTFILDTQNNYISLQVDVGLYGIEWYVTNHHPLRLVDL